MNFNKFDDYNPTYLKSNQNLPLKLRTKPSFQALDLTYYNELCAELKMLYVAVTRPRKRLIIFDSDTSRRLVI